MLEELNSLPWESIAYCGAIIGFFIGVLFTYILIQFLIYTEGYRWRKLYIYNKAKNEEIAKLIENYIEEPIYHIREIYKKTNNLDVKLELESLLRFKNRVLYDK